MRTLVLLIWLGALGWAQDASRTSPAKETKEQRSKLYTKPVETSGQKAWSILHDGLKDTNAEKREKAVRALGLLTGNTEAEKAAVWALKDEKPGVRVAAAGGPRFDARGRGQGKS
jgi:hypothetical protein